MFVSVARADQWDKKTVVTFSQAVEVPGQVLPRGTYVLKRVESQWDRSIVQIFTKDESQVLATILAVPDYRLEPTEKTVISFEERPSGRPEAVRSWFYPGDNYGMKFVYPNRAVQVAANSQPTVPTAEPAAAATAPAIPPQTERESIAALPQPEPQIVAQNTAQNTAVQPEESVPASLPKTASNFLALPLIGMALLCGGFIMFYKVRQGTERA